MLLRPEPPPGQGLLDRRPQAGQPVLEQVVVGALPHGRDRDVFAHRAGDEDERQVESALAHEPQRFQAVEARQGVVREDDVERRVQAVPELLLGFDALADRLVAGEAQFTHQQFDVVGLVFQKQDS